MFLRSILFLMMLLIPLFCAQSVMDVLNKNHEKRNGYFNVNPSDEKIPECTNTINGVLAKQPIKLVADDKEKEQLLKTEMARAIIHRDHISNDYAALQSLYASNANYFECLEIIQKLSNWFVEKITDPCFNTSVIGNDVLLQKSLNQFIQDNEEKSSALKKLCSYCKLQENKITQWFVETLREHMDGVKILFKKNLSQQKFIQDIKNGTKIDGYDFPYKDIKYALPTFREAIDKINHPNMGQILFDLYKFGTQLDKDNIQSIALNSEDPRQILAISVLGWEPFSAKIREIRDTTLPILRAAAIKQNDKNAYHAAKALFDLGNNEDKEIARPILRAAVQEKSDPYAYHIAQTLFRGNYADEADKAITRPFLVVIAKDPTRENHWDAVKMLWDSHEEADRAIAWSFLVIIAKDPTHENHWDAVKMLWDSFEEADKAIARPSLVVIAKDPTHENHWDAVKMLWGSYDEAGKVIARPFLVVIAKDPTHENHWDAIVMLWHRCVKTDNDIARPFLEEIAKDLTHQHHWYSVILLWNSNEADKVIARPFLVLIANDPTHENHWGAVQKLWSSNEADKAIARPFLVTVANDLTHKNHWNALLSLWRSSLDADKPIARINLRTIAQDPEHQYQREAISMLRESNEPGDQELGLRLQQRYFPVTLMPQTIVRQAQYNLPAIRSAMPIPLADLSGEQTNIAVEVGLLMNMISADEANPLYLSPTGITGEAFENRTLEQIKNRVMVFVKTLSGQPLTEHETSGWQMYEDNKPAMINSFKHIIKAVNTELETDASGAMTHLGIVMNGILRCPTGQAEALESAIKTLVHGKNVVSSNAQELVGKYIIVPAVEKAFNNAFHHLGEVHALARARMSLAPELGFSHAIAGFQERISRVADAEIPGFYNDFYAQFTPQFILAEARRNIQTPKEYDAILNATTPEARKRSKNIKLEKLISVSSIYQWLIDQGEQENLNTQFGISEDFTAISNKGIINLLIKMGYLNRESPALQDFIGRLA